VMMAADPNLGRDGLNTKITEAAGKSYGGPELYACLRFHHIASVTTYIFAAKFSWGAFKDHPKIVEQWCRIKNIPPCPW
jgi:hypothetical protein